jgi:protease secretion system membrane fusion protein
VQEKSAFAKEVDRELSEIQKNRKAFKLNAESVRFNLSLAEIKAPVDGVVVGLQVFTEGGVIKGSETLMEIVPQKGNLLVHAKVPPDYVDNVRVGQEADLRFTAFNRATTPVVPGKVVLVGADRQLKTAEDNEATPPEYYLAHVETTPEGVALLGGNNVQAGMSVDVIVKTGERTFMSYLLKPIVDRLAISFKEN